MQKLIFLAFIAAGTAGGGLASSVIIYAGVLGGIVGLILAILAIVDGTAALAKIDRHPGKYSGGGKAIAGILLGVFFLTALLILLAVFLL